MTDDYRPQMNPGNVVPAGQLPPGRELDALVAEKVMGWPAARDAKAIGEAGYWTAGDERFIHGLPAFSTDIAAAWGVVERMVARMDEEDRFSSQDRFSWQGPLYKPTSHYLTNEGYPLGTTCWYVVLETAGRRRLICADTAPHAICLAALKAVGA